MHDLTLNAHVKTETGKCFNRQLRMEGKIPAIIYGKDKNPLSIIIDKQEFVPNLQKHENYENIIFDIKISGKVQKKKRQTIIKEIQQDPCTGKLLHVDFFEISMDKPVALRVHISFVGESIGVKQDGGIIDHIMREVEIECLPSDIPEHMEVDISNLKIGDSLHVRDLVIPENVQLLDNPDKTVVSVLPPIKEKTAEELAAEAAEEPTEPEVIKKGAQEEEEGTSKEKE